MASEYQESFRILIVGGGIAGLATAIALRKPGRSILILEQSSLNREIGATISLQPNASKIVEKTWGLGDELKARGSMIDKAFRVCSVDGKEQTRIDLTAKAEYGGDRVVYHRQDLHDVLKAAATAGPEADGYATIRVSSRVVSADCEAGSVELESSEVLGGFDFIIGADGIRSRVRESVLGRKMDAVPTGHAAYRMMINSKDIEGDEDISKFLDPRDSCTTMVMAHGCRLIMGPARNGDLYSIVAMVPDASSAEDNANNNSWNTQGDMQALLESFKQFPDWCKRLFKHSSELGLWQLRDLDPLDTWTKGRVIIIGDASHAMLPTQGQGASQSIEDAEAVGSFFSEVSSKPTAEEVQAITKNIEQSRISRATLIQLYSRQMAKPATEVGDIRIKLNLAQFMDYNCLYDGAKDWLKRQAAPESA